MAPIDHDPRVTPTAKPSAVDAARVALTTPAPRQSPARDRIRRAATVLWCRDLQFPTLRDIARVTGHRSPSGVITPFGRCIDIQAAIIRTEWDQASRDWATAPVGCRPRWLAQHAFQLASIEGACLRLPGLVCSAVVAAEITVLPALDVLVPLYALAALAHPGTGDDPHAAAAVAAVLASTRDRHRMAVSA